jgi:hypothetical protein
MKKTNPDFLNGVPELLLTHTTRLCHENQIDTFRILLSHGVGNEMTKGKPAIGNNTGTQCDAMG